LNGGRIQTKRKKEVSIASRRKPEFGRKPGKQKQKEKLCRGSGRKKKGKLQKKGEKGIKKLKSEHMQTPPER